MKQLPKTATTPYGTVDQANLENLRRSYDTSDVLDIVDMLDACRARLADPDGMRADLLRLHAMAHTVVNGGPLSVVQDETGIWEMADELVTECKDWIRVLTVAAERLAPLADLVSKDATDQPYFGK